MGKKKSGEKRSHREVALTGQEGAQVQKFRRSKGEGKRSAGLGGKVEKKKGKSSDQSLTRLPEREKSGSAKKRWGEGGELPDSGSRRRLSLRRGRKLGEV